MDQLLVGDALARNARHEAVQPLHGVAVDVAFVQPERELIDVATKVLLARMVIDADQAALEDGEHALDAVGRDAIADILALAVVDRLVAVEHPRQTTIGRSLIGVERGTCQGTKVYNSLKKARRK